MKLLEERIIADGKVIGDDILKVDMFLNHQIDVHLLQEIGKEFKRRFDGCNINKILTIEASGIGIACITAQYFSVPVVFAKKGAHKNVGSNVYSSVVHSFTKGTDSNVTVSKDYINKDDKILIIDDFLANGAAVSGLIDIINQAGAELEGVGIAIEKAYWGRGIGKALTLACIECAKQAGYLQIELEVVAENASAVRLYESVGFQEYGRNPRGFRARSGWQTLVLMRLELDS